MGSAKRRSWLTLQVRILPLLLKNKVMNIKQLKESIANLPDEPDEPEVPEVPLQPSQQYLTHNTSLYANGVELLDDKYTHPSCQ